MRLLLSCFCLFMMLASCVSNKKFTYLQKGDNNKKDMPKDTVVRTYLLDDFDYKVQPQDILSVRFESLTPQELDFLSAGESRQNLNLQGGNALVLGELVDMHGEIPIPVVGKFRVAGLNVFQIQDTLQQIADRYMESPVVKVRLINFRFTILGEVMQEGTVTVGNNRVTMMEAIGLAGGTSDIADKSKVKVIRMAGDKAEVFYVNLLDEQFVSSPFYFVHQSDVLIVPPLKQRPFRKYAGQNIGLVISSISLLLLVYNLFY
jgi:polysaccharide biosynthesis/export protein